jgi:hypothetical protein
MKKSVILGFIFGLSLAAGDLSGKWSGKAMFPDSPQTRQPGKAVELNLVQNGSQVKGTFSLAAGKPLPIEAGTLRDGKLTFALHMPDLVTVQLNQEGERLEGRMTSSQGELQYIGVQRR